MVTNTMCLSCLTIASSATKKLGPDKKRFNVMAAIYGITENVTLAFPAKTTGQQSKRRMTLSGVVLLVSPAVILLRIFIFSPRFSSTGRTTMPTKFSPPPSKVV